VHSIGGFCMWSTRTAYNQYFFTTVLPFGICTRFRRLEVCCSESMLGRGHLLNEPRDPEGCLLCHHIAKGGMGPIFLPCVMFLLWTLCLGIGDKE
jgi:hypothetical protein